MKVRYKMTSQPACPFCISTNKKNQLSVLSTSGCAYNIVIFSSDLYDDIRTLNEAEHLGKILTKRREIYLRQGQLGHGLILMKLSKVQEKLGKNSEAYQNKEKAFEIAKICLGEKLTDELRQNKN